jgi:hypothetical protein
MQFRTTLIAFAGALYALAPIASAQVLRTPPRSAPVRTGPTSDRVRQELVVEANALGGYDDNLNPAGGELVRPQPGGTLGFAETNVRYSVQKRGHALDLNGRGYGNTYSTANTTTSYGGEQTARVRTNAGRRTQFELSEAFRSSPFFSLGAFGAVNTATGGDTPEASPTNGLAQTRSNSLNFSGTIRHEWTPRTKTSAGYSFGTEQYRTAAFPDSRTHHGTIGFEKMVGRTGGFSATYGQTHSRYDEVNGPRDFVDHSLEGGVLYRRQVSRTRQVSFAAGGGSTYVDTTSRITGAPLQYWAPSAYGNARLDIGRSWNVSGDYRRAVQVLEGLNPEPYTSNVAVIRLGGQMTSRLDTVLSLSYANGVNSLGGTVAAGKYDSVTGAAQTRYRWSKNWYSVVNYSRLQNHLNEIAARSLGVAQTIDRNSFRVGFTWILPLLNAPATPRAQPGAGAVPE